MSRDIIFVSLFWLVVSALVVARVYFYPEIAAGAESSARASNTHATQGSVTETR